MSETKKSTESDSTETDSTEGDSTETDSTRETFTAEERAAMKERARELKTANRRGKAEKAAAEAQDVVDAIAAMPEADRVIAERLHSIIAENGPDLAPRLWYGMPAYARDGKIVCFFQAAKKFDTRYGTLGFNDVAKLDDGNVWPSAYAIISLTKADEAKIAGLIKRAVG